MAELWQNNRNLLAIKIKTMGYVEDFGYDCYDEPKETIGYIKTIENNKVVEKPYCLNCGSLNIKTSKKENLYCADLCWVKEKNNN